ncbi:MAG: hypothetical protein ACQEWM_05990 [Actinomycetota bacterium]
MQMQTSVPGGGKPSLKDAHWRVGPWLSVVPELEARVTDDAWGYEVHVTLRFSRTDLRYLAQQVCIHLAGAGHSEADANEVNGGVLRQVRLAEIVRRVALGGIILNGEQPIPAFDDSEASTFSHLAMIYTSALISSEPPAKAVERHFGWPPRTAARWIAKAKDAGVLQRPAVEMHEMTEAEVAAMDAEAERWRSKHEETGHGERSEAS